MTDTPNIGLKKYGTTDAANLLSGYNASMDTLDTVIKQAEDDIDDLQDSVGKFLYRQNNWGSKATVSGTYSLAIEFQPRVGRIVLVFTGASLTINNKTYSNLQLYGAITSGNVTWKAEGLYNGTWESLPF